MSFSFSFLRLYFVQLLLTVPVVASAQISDWESGSLKTQEKDTQYLNQLINDNFRLLYRNPDSAYLVSQNIIELSEKLDYIKGEAGGLKLIGDYYKLLEDDFQAVQYYDRSIEIYEQIEEYELVSEIEIYLGHIFLGLGDKDKALEYFNLSMRNALKAKDSIQISYAYQAIGDVYRKDETTFDRVVDNYLRSIEILEETQDSMELGVCYLQLGYFYLGNGKTDQAIPYLKKSDNYFTRSPTPKVVLGQAYLKLNQFQRAKDHYIGMMNDPMVMDGVGIYNGLGNAELGLKNYSLAISHFNNALLSLEERNKNYIGMGPPEGAALLEQKEPLKGLVKAYTNLYDFKNASLYQSKLDSVQESLLSLAEAQKEDLGKQLQALYKNDFENQSRKFEIQQQIDRQTKTRLYFGLGVFVLIALGLTNRFLFIRKTNKKISREKDRSDALLNNILPEETAEELKANGSIKAKQFNQITVLFTDFKAFSVIAESISPEKLVDSVDYYFKHFDAIVEKYDLEKIKTIGDAYMCAGGIPRPNETHAEDAMKAAVEICDFVEKIKQYPPENIHPFEIRIGLNSGPVVAGVVGTKKFAYDIWGNTVNIAARMESRSEPGRINVSESTYQLLKDKYDFTYRGELEVKNGQVLKMYFADAESKVPAQKAL